MGVLFCRVFILWLRISCVDFDVLCLVVMVSGGALWYIITLRFRFRSVLVLTFMSVVRNFVVVVALFPVGLGFVLDARVACAFGDFDLVDFGILSVGFSVVLLVLFSVWS